MLTWKVAGPLMTSSIALFGNGSWFSTAANYVSMSNKTYDSTDDDKLPWQLMCSGIPFGNLVLRFLDNHGEDFASECRMSERNLFDGYKLAEQDLRFVMSAALGAFAPANYEERSLNTTENLLEAAMFVANRALLTLISPEENQRSYELRGRKIYTSPGLTVQRPVLSKAALIILSVLLGLQLLGLSYLTYYLYRFPTWSDQLDAMAIARIGASLDHRGVLPALGPVRQKDTDALKTVDGLIGIVEKESHRESSTSRLVSPDPNTTDASEVELQQLNPTEEGRTNAEHRSPDVELGLGASGAILSTNLPRRSPYVLGLKKAWTATFITRVPSTVDDD
jgi:hypothetical protein